MSELKSCPFCAASLVFHSALRDTGDNWYEHPDNECVLAAQALGDSFTVFDNPTAIAAWNRRAPPQAAQPAEPWASINLNVDAICMAIDKIMDTINQKREPGWSYRNTITTNRNVIREQCEAIRDALAGAQPERQVEFSRDDDGELAIDWSPMKGRMLSVSLRDDGRMSYALTWDGYKEHGTVQMPRAAQPEPRPLTEEKVLQAIRRAGPTEHQWDALVRESGPYDIDTPRAFTMLFVGAVVAMQADSGKEEGGRDN